VFIAEQLWAKGTQFLHFERRKVMKPNGRQMVITIDADTGKIVSVKNEKDEDIKKNHWPESGLTISNVTNHYPCAIIVYEESPQDCIIFHNGVCDYWQYGC
jgi:hypothetical protein